MNSSSKSSSQAVSADRNPSVAIGSVSEGEATAPPVRPGVTRRRFLGGAATAAGLAGLAASTAPSLTRAAEARVRRYVPLGRTGMNISDVSLGSSGLDDPEVVRLALDRGVNYFDCAESYMGGRAESAFGQVLPAVRDKVYITTKHKFHPGHSVKDMMRRLEFSLQRLRTDYVDVHFNHAVNDVDRVSNPQWHEFVELAKKQGKIRFAGVSGHGSNLAEALDHVLDNDLVDVILTAYNFGQDPDFMSRLKSQFSYVAIQQGLPERLEKARAKGVGVVAMKVLYGARLNDMRKYEDQGASFSQAALSWVLSGPYADAAVISMDRPADVDEYLPASGRAFTATTDLPLLERYATMQYGKYCHHGCNACAGSCPADAAIAEVLRTRMYAVDYRRPDLGRRDYGQLAGGASACLTCSGAPCLNACPHGVPIATYMREAAGLLG